MKRTATANPNRSFRPSRRHFVVLVNMIVVGILGVSGAETMAQENSGREPAAAKGQRRTTNSSPSLRSLPVQFRAVSREGNANERPSAVASGTEPASLPLAPPRRASSSDRETSGASSPVRSSITTMASLCLIAGCVCAVLWFARRNAPAPRGRLPNEVFELLGKAQLSPRLEVHLLRIGGKVVLVGSTASAANTLVEISDAEEAERIAAACVPGRATSVAASMRQAFSRLDVESPAPTTPLPRPRRYSPEVADV